MFKNKVVIITGGAHGIGKCIKEEFEKAGAKCFIIDKSEGNHFVGDISEPTTLEIFVQHVINQCKHVDYIINNAAPLFKGINSCSYDEFNYALKVGVSAPFYLTKLCLPYFREGAAIVNISSTREKMSMPQSESYASAKGGIASLTHALSISLGNKVRVNSISPGWIDTDFKKYDGPDALQHPVNRIGNPLDIANMVLFLCSDKASFITGENITIDGGMSKLMIYHEEHGWKYEL